MGILLAYLNPKTELALTTNASDTALKAVLQQKTKAEWRLLAFLNKKLSRAQTKYSPYLILTYLQSLSLIVHY